MADASTQPAGQGPSTPQGNARRWQRLLLRTILAEIAVILVLFALRNVAWRDVPGYLGRLGPATLGLAALAYTAAWTMRIARLHVLAKATGIPLGARDAAQTALGANALNIVAPARLGDVAAYVHLRSEGAAGPEAAAVMVTWRLGDLGALLVFALLAGPVVLLLVPVHSATTGLVAVMAGGAGFLAIGAAGIYLARHHKVRAVLDRIATRLLGSRAPTGAAFGRATAHLWTPRLFAASLALAIAAWIADALLAGVILDALWDGPNAYAVVIIPVILANAAKTLPTTPGSIGVFEVVFGVALNQYVGDPASAAVFGFAAVAVHLFVNVLTLGLGLPGAVAIGRSVSRSAARQADAGLTK
ncbi:MAG: lysylphosphatidylglycerol synthase transmembrane domain-containing protein [bacterium]